LGEGTRRLVPNENRHRTAANDVKVAAIWTRGSVRRPRWDASGQATVRGSEVLGAEAPVRPRELSEPAGFSSNEDAEGSANHIHIAPIGGDPDASGGADASPVRAVAICYARRKAAGSRGELGQCASRKYGLSG
jgi:hypothetical protein